ncbi:MAG: hypothetical protein ACI4OJ_12830 [Lachnospiraceae bacterium]
MRQMQKLYFAAFFTVEASLLAVIILPILLCLWFSAFFLYDRCRLAEELSVLAFEAAEKKGEEDAAERITAASLRAAYPGCREITVEARKENGFITARGTADAGAGQKIAGLLPVSNRIFQVEAVAAAKKQDAPLLLWKQRRIADQIKKLGSRNGGENS